MNSNRKFQSKIGGISCSFCVNTIQKALSQLDGVEKVSVSLAHEEVLVHFDPQRTNETRIKTVLKQLGYTLRDPRKEKTYEEEEQEKHLAKKRLLNSIGLSIVAIGLMLTMRLGYSGVWLKWAMITLAVLTMFAPGGYIMSMAIQSLRRGILNQHVLMEFGAFAGLIGGIFGLFYPNFPTADFAAVTVFITTYHILSGYTSLLVRIKASQSVRKLLSLQPMTARVIRNGEELEVPLESVKTGERVRVRPGENIPVDGRVVEGISEVDESLVTGESIPIPKKPGNEVIGGSLNQTGTLVVEVTRVGEESFLQQVARYIEEARAMKPGIIQLVDQILKVYVPVVLIFAAIGILIWTIGFYLIIGEINWIRGLYAALAVLVMGYPCALGMATPLAMIRGGGLAAQKGILMRSAEAFQVLKDVKCAVLDKTGTLTRGKPAVMEILPMNGVSVETLVGLAASAEKPSEHPLARAIVKYAKQHGISISEVGEFKALPGQGVICQLNTRQVLVGKTRFLQENGIPTSDVTEKIASLENKGQTVVGVATNRQLLGFIGIADPIKDDARWTIQQLQSLGIKPMMVTGDNPRTAQAVASQLGIRHIKAGILPDQKASIIRKLQQNGQRVIMVGDGINDAPALMQADVGIAMGAGTDIAIESADIIIIGEHLRALVDAIEIGKNSYRKTVQNLILAFSFNGIGIPLAVTGFLHPIWAMVAMVASVSTVLLNSFAGKLLPRKSIPSSKTELKQITFSIPNMHCQGCLRTINTVLEQKIGNVKVEADFKTHRLIVIFSNREITEDGIRELLIEAGFKPEYS